MGILKTWWFWGIVIAAGVGIYLLVDSKKEETKAPNTSGNPSK